MTTWLQRIALLTADRLHAAIDWAFAFMALMLLFALLCIAMRRGNRVSLGGSRGFVFEASPPKSTSKTKGAP